MYITQANGFRFKFFMELKVQLIAFSKNSSGFGVTRSLADLLWFKTAPVLEMFQVVYESFKLVNAINFEWGVEVGFASD